MNKRFQVLFIIIGFLLLGFPICLAQWGGNMMMSITKGQQGTLPHPVSIVPSSASISDTSGSGVLITTFIVGMSDNSTFTGSIQVTDSTAPNGIVCTSSPCTLSSNALTTARALTAGDDGNHPLTIAATENSTYSISFSLSVTSGAGVACQQGPNFLGSLPADVTTAGFTTCAVNADFTSSTTDTNNINYSNITTWLAECGAPSRTYNFHVQYWYNITSVPCGTGATGVGGRMSIVSDPLGGGFNVLEGSYLVSADQSQYLSYEAGCGQCGGTYNYSDIGLTWPSIGGGSVGLPYEFYLEITFYAPTATMNSKNPSAPGTTFFALNSTTTTSTPPLGSQAHLAVDQFEIIQQNTNSGATSWQWGSGIGIYGPGGYSGSVGDNLAPFNFTSGYNTIGQLITSNETNTLDTCSYINGSIAVPYGCNGVNVSTSGATACSGGGYACYFGQNSVIPRLYFAVATCLVLSTTPCYSNDLHYYIKSIRIFTCSNYKSGQCPGTIITAQNSTAPKYYANDNSPEGLIRQAVTWLLGKAA
jgi:hypothetical protein